MKCDKEVYDYFLAYLLTLSFLHTAVQSWIVCDGDIDPEWIESLNSVLDDNRLLTMPSGERIQFGPNVNFLFETHDLSCASPATISRMGMIFLRLVGRKDPGSKGSKKFQVDACFHITSCSSLTCSRKIGKAAVKAN